jgi:hypothetical protein
MIDGYDLSDSLVRELVGRNHVPREDRDRTGKMIVTCVKCWQTWPCDVRVALREFREDQMSKTWDEISNE